MNIHSLPQAELKELINRRTDCVQLISRAFHKLQSSKNTKDDPEVASMLISAAILLHTEGALKAIEAVLNTPPTEEAPEQQEEQKPPQGEDEQNEHD